MVDSWEEWVDFWLFVLCLFGVCEVWLGYDLSGGGLIGDSVVIVVLVLLVVLDGKFCVLEKYQFKGIDFEEQVNVIFCVCNCYNVVFIGIDCMGVGDVVYQFVMKVRLDVYGFFYFVDVKMNLVLKVYDVISKGCLEFDVGWMDFVVLFMLIKKIVIVFGVCVIYQVGCLEEISYVDLVWVCMYVFLYELFEGVILINISFMEFL